MSSNLFTGFNWGILFFTFYGTELISNLFWFKATNYWFHILLKLQTMSDDSHFENEFQPVFFQNRNFEPLLTSQPMEGLVCGRRG